MPIYEFQCPECKSVISKLCKTGETGEKIICSRCGHEGLTKKISGFSAPGVSGGKECSTGCCGNCSTCH